MEKEILNLEEAAQLLEVGERTLLKLLRDEHLPARKIGREWRFSRSALINWISIGDSVEYINKDEVYEVCIDEEGAYESLISKLLTDINTMNENKTLNAVLKELPRELTIPEDLTLRVSYKQKRDVEKLAFKLYWPLTEERKLINK